MIKLTGSVGRMGLNKKHDVALVQRAFGAIRTKTRFGMKPLWPKKPDGRNSKELEAAIVCFQEEHRLKPTGKLECTAQTLNALTRALPPGERNLLSVPGTAAVAAAGTSNRPAERVARETEAKAPFPKKERKALAGAQIRVGKETGFVLRRQRDFVTGDGRFATQLAFDISTVPEAGTGRDVEKALIKIVEAGPEWQAIAGGRLAFRTRLQLNALKGLGSGPLPADDKKLLGITTPPREAVLLACAKGCAGLISSGQLATSTGKAELDLLLQAIGAPNAQLAKQIAQVAGKGGSGAASATNLPIHFDPSADPTVVRQHSLNVLRDAMVQAGVKSIRITSTSRTPAEQARIMFELIDQRGELFAKQLYRRQVHSVIDIYTTGRRRGLSRIQIIANMEIEILALRASDPTLFKHIADPNILNTIDIAPSSISIQTAKAKFIAALKTDQRVQRVIEPPLDPAIHVEIPQP